MSPTITCPECGGGACHRMGGINYACSSCLSMFKVRKSENLNVPDHIGEVIGFRAWHIVETSDGTRLASTGFGGKFAKQVWIPGEVNEALCSGERQHPNGVPDEGCSCGFYAARSRDHLLSLDRYHKYDSPDTVGGKATAIGQVAMDGKVIPASNGWRAQYAWALNIMVPHVHWRHVEGLNEAYGEWCEVSLENTLEMPASDAPAWCSKCGIKLKPRACKCAHCGTLVGD